MLVLLFVMLTLLLSKLSGCNAYSVTRINNRRAFSSISSSLKKNEEVVKEYLVDDWRHAKVFKYDTSLYPFNEAVKEILSHYIGKPLTVPLSQLHTVDGFNTYITTMSGARLNMLQDMWNKERDRKEADLFCKFDEIYTKFISNVIAPSLKGGRIVFQRAPSLRVQVPSTSCLGSLHCDLDYHHQPSELNYWLILSDKSYDGASLHVESYPNKGDFKPIEINYGECFSFYGNRCRHQTVPNLTNTTRVSLDFRVLSDMTGGHDPTFHAGIRRGAKAKFQRKFDIGGFYGEINTPYL